MRTGGGGKHLPSVTWLQGTWDRWAEKQHLQTIIIDRTNFPYSTCFKQLISVNLHTNSGRFSSLNSLISHIKYHPIYCENERWLLQPSSVLRLCCLEMYTTSQMPRIKYFGSQSPGPQWWQPTRQRRTKQFPKTQRSPWPGVANEGEGSYCRKMPQLHKWTKNKQTKQIIKFSDPTAPCQPHHSLTKAFCDWQCPLPLLQLDRTPAVTSSQTCTITPVESWYQENYKLLAF